MTTALARAQEIFDSDNPAPEGGVLDPSAYPELYATHLELGRAFGGDEPPARRR